MTDTAPSSQSEIRAALLREREVVAGLRLREAFAADPERFRRLSLRLDDMLLDYSKNLVTDVAMALLCQYARAAKVEDRTRRLFEGEKVNGTENRPALHTALRNRTPAPVLVDGRDAMPGIRRNLERMGALVDEVRNGERRGATGQPFRSVVHIGVGGSEVGPRMATIALEAHRLPGLDFHFVANVDGQAIAGALDRVDAATTLFIVASKTFTTEETMTNARTARDWLVARLGEDKAALKHFVAVSGNDAAVDAFGIVPENRFPLWEWVGGRYSLWSAVGLPVALAIGMKGFLEMLDGAQAMDAHFRTAPIEHNMPVILALLGFWYGAFFKAETQAVIPYAEALRALPEYLQQLDMESGGKSVRRDGAPVEGPTGPIVWGGAGSSGQHAFHQRLHQGTRLVPADFILWAEGGGRLGAHHDLLVANGLAQARALMIGKTVEEARGELLAAGASEGEAARLAPHLAMQGNRPSTTILSRRLDPYALGRLIALYEHKVFVQGVLWDIETFDQWGVELGKTMARDIAAALRGQGPLPADSSTTGLLRHCLDLRGGDGI